MAFLFSCQHGKPPRDVLLIASEDYIPIGQEKEKRQEKHEI